MEVAETTIHITCDYCGEELEMPCTVEIDNRYLYNQYRYKHVYQWRKIGGENICPECWVKNQALRIKKDM